MMLRSLRTVADALPFHIDDSVRANEAFLRWHRQPTDEDKRLIDLWTYCYIYRYFVAKFAATDQHTPLCFDGLVANAFADVQQHLHSIRQPDSYTGWVATICKHTFVNYLRTRRISVSLEEDAPVLIVEDPPSIGGHDAAVVHQSICAAIDALPGFLRQVARLRLLERRSYETISHITGKARPTLRAYLNRALGQLRRNENLLALLHELQD